AGAHGGGGGLGTGARLPLVCLGRRAGQRRQRCRPLRRGVCGGWSGAVLPEGPLTRMAFKPSTWYPIAVVLSVVNLAGAGFALGRAQPEHAAIHGALAVAFGLWARRLRRRPDEKELPGGSELQDRFEALEGEVSQLRQELSETQERLDFL